MEPTYKELALFAEMALGHLHQEYPNHIVHFMQSAADVRAPRTLTPAFYGSFDWHSSVHAHWTLTRVLRFGPGDATRKRIIAALDQSLTPANLAGELRYLERRKSFERPYGLAWLLTLASELRHCTAPEATAWRQGLGPLEQLAAERIVEWTGKLTHPVRTGEHSQSAFAMALTLDWARATGDQRTALAIHERALHFYGRDTRAPLAYEPSGQDFLSPILGEADLMRRVLEPKDFGSWLALFLPELAAARGDWLSPVEPRDKADGKLVHLIGLSLSRAWMLRGIASGLAADDPRLAALSEAAARHLGHGLAGIDPKEYAGAHWLSTFAVFLLTGANVPLSNKQLK